MQVFAPCAKLASLVVTATLGGLFMTEYLEILRRSPLFRGIEAEELSALLDCMG